MTGAAPLSRITVLDTTGGAASTLGITAGIGALGLISGAGFGMAAGAAAACTGGSAMLCFITCTGFSGGFSGVSSSCAGFSSASRSTNASRTMASTAS